MAHATLLKFGYPDTLIHEGEHWVVLTRPAQVTLGSLVLCAKSEATSYADLPPAAFLEQRSLVRSIEQMLRAHVQAERINYLMLMMVDPHVHFHVLPRYRGERELDGVARSDSAWPGPPDLSQTAPLSPSLVSALKQRWRTAT